ncbi:hypothetical protein [Nostoc sp. ATCC 53789]|uniref:hypothetical protein n=1 Tax=Nostoc sp. ATCC 53789 TaxID=76335 RepID=UPI000E05ABBB|nr:hypothetical protein [Nostoc sp. ATCC 53789]RCJ20386.1 hypothetical protein A6V25_25930 [Nostoc sp. ATCC 53789]
MTAIGRYSYCGKQTVLLKSYQLFLREWGIVEPAGELAGLPFPINAQMLRHGTGYPKANRGDEVCRC